MSRYNNIPVFIINMPNRPERKEHMKSLMNQLGFTNFTFVVPYPANEETQQLFDKEMEKNIGLSITNSSHSMTYISLLKLQNVDEMIIMEDDIILTKPLEVVKQELNVIVNNHPLDADMIYMEMCYENCNMNTVDGFLKLDNPLCAAAIYYPSKQSRENLVKMIINDAIFKTDIDNAFAYLISKNYVNAYMHDLLFIQDNNFGSDLEGSVGYDSEYKPMIPICHNIHNTVSFLNDEGYKEQYKEEIRNMYEQELSYQIEKLKCEFEEEDDFTIIINKKNSRHLIVIIILLIFIIMILSSFLLNRCNTNNSQYSYHYS